MFRHFLFLSILTNFAVAADDIEFCAFLRVGTQELFVLGDPAAGKSSEWLRIGQSFSGYSIISFDAQSEALTVKAGERTRTIFLRSGTTRDSAHEIEQSALSARLEMAKAVLSTMRTRYRGAHPAVKAQLKEIAELERKVATLHAKP